MPVRRRQSSGDPVEDLVTVIDDQRRRIERLERELARLVRECCS